MRLHLKVFVGVLPLWIVTIFMMEWLVNGTLDVFQQRGVLIIAAMVTFTADLLTACIFKIWARGEDEFSSRGLISGGKKAALWIVIAGGATIWSNTFPNDPENVSWMDPRWLGANIDLLAFLYIYAVDTVSSIENITGKSFGETTIGRGGKAVVETFFPRGEEILSRVSDDDQ